MHGLVIFTALLSMLFFVVAVIFWIWTLIDCVTNKRLTDSQKIVWALVIFFVGVIGSVIYFFAGRTPKAYVPPVPYYYSPQIQDQSRLGPAVTEDYRSYQEGYRAREGSQPGLSNATIVTNEDQPASQQVQYEHIQISYPE